MIDKDIDMIDKTKIMIEKIRIANKEMRTEGDNPYLHQDDR